MAQIGKVLQDARCEKKLSIRAAAVKIGISAMYLSKIESGKQIPSDEVLGKIANFYGLNLADLIRVARFSTVREGDRRQKLARLVYEADDDTLNTIEKMFRNAMIRRDNSDK